LNPNYTKPLLRRAQAYEKTEKLDEALEDYKKLLELDKRNPEAISACRVSLCFFIELNCLLMVLYIMYYYIFL